MLFLSRSVKHFGLPGALFSLPCAVLFGVLLVGACAPLQHTTRDRTEYEAYRRTRLGKTLEARLRAASEYLSHGYQGASRRETEAWFYPAERRFFLASRGSLEAISRYLAVLPNGPHRAAAEARIGELLSVKRKEVTREKEQAERERRALASVDQARVDRKHFVQEFSRWVRLLLTIRGWGGAMSELPREFVHEFRLTAPEAQCTESSCEKLLNFEFAVPENGKLITRQAPLAVTLRLVSGAVVSAEVHGDALFSRLSEALTLSSVTYGDGQARMEGIARALSLVELLIAPTLPEPGCSRPVESPEVLARACEGLDFRMIPAGVGLSGEDRLVVSPSHEVGQNAGPIAPIPKAPKLPAQPTP